MVRAIGLLIVFVVLEVVFGDLHPWEFLAKRLAPAVYLVPPPPVVKPSPALNGEPV
jgi:hypothetical protein